MGKRFWICGLVVSMAALLLGFLVHGVLLRQDYLAHADIFRSRDEASARFGWILPAWLLFGCAMTWLFRRLHQGRDTSLREGLAFGIAIGLVSFVPLHLLAHVGQPLPLSLTLRQVAFDLASTGLLGMLLAWLRPHRVELAAPADN